MQRAWHPSGAGDTGRPLAPGLLATLRPRLPRGSRPATLLPGLQSHHLGDRDAAATACLASHEPRASRLCPSSQTLQGPGSAKVGLAQAGPPLSGASWGSLGPPRGAEAPPYWLPPALGNRVSWGQRWQTGQCGGAMPVGPLMGLGQAGEATAVWHCHLPPGGCGAICMARGWGLGGGTEVTLVPPPLGPIGTLSTSCQRGPALAAWPGLSRLGATIPQPRGASPERLSPAPSPTGGPGARPGHPGPHPTASQASMRPGQQETALCAARRPLQSHLRGWMPGEPPGPRT